MNRKEMLPISPSDAARADDLLSKQLQRLGMHRTKQKSVILLSLLQAPEPVSAQELLYLVKQEDLFVSFGTVYRTLRTMVACGLATEIVSADGVTRYAPKVEPGGCTHPHLVCAACGTVVRGNEAASGAAVHENNVTQD